MVFFAEPKEEKLSIIDTSSMDIEEMVKIFNSTFSGEQFYIQEFEFDDIDPSYEPISDELDDVLFTSESVERFINNETDSFDIVDKEEEDEDD